METDYCSFFQQIFFRNVKNSYRATGAISAAAALPAADALQSGPCTDRNREQLRLSRSSVRAFWGSSRARNCTASRIGRQLAALCMAHNRDNSDTSTGRPIAASSNRCKERRHGALRQPILPGEYTFMRQAPPSHPLTRRAKRATCFSPCHVLFCHSSSLFVRFLLKNRGQRYDTSGRLPSSI